MITVIGANKRQKAYIESITLYVLKKLLPRVKKYDIEIRLCKLKDANGYCLEADNREFEIEINKTLGQREMLQTLAHELVHVKQYIRKEFDPAEEKMDYWDRPTEIEAHGRECGLFIRWAEANNLAKYKWTQVPG